MFALLAGAANPYADGPPDSAARNPRAGRPAFSGYVADVEVFLGGVTRYGRIIVTRDGCVHLEHLDEQARRWVYGVIHRESSTSNGWDDRPLRAGPVRRVWGRIGPNVVLAEIHATDGSLRISQHKLVAAR